MTHVRKATDETRGAPLLTTPVASPTPPPPFCPWRLALALDRARCAATPHGRKATISSAPGRTSRRGLWTI